MSFSQAGSGARLALCCPFLRERTSPKDPVSVRMNPPALFYRNPWKLWHDPVFRVVWELHRTSEPQ